MTEAKSLHGPQPPETEPPPFCCSRCGREVDSSDQNCSDCGMSLVVVRVSPLSLAEQTSWKRGWWGQTRPRERIRDVLLAVVLGSVALLVTAPFTVPAVALLLNPRTMDVPWEYWVFATVWNAWFLGLPVGRVAWYWAHQTLHHPQEERRCLREYWQTQAIVLTPLAVLCVLSLWLALVVTVVSWVLGD